MSESYAEKLYTSVDAFKSGVQGYQRLHKEVSEDKSLCTKDTSAIERTIISFAEKTNHKEYIASLKEYLKKLSTVINNFAPVLKKFKDHLQGVEKVLKHRDTLEAFLKAYNNRNPTKKADNKSETALSVTKHLREAHGLALKKEMLEAVQAYAEDRKEDWVRLWGSSNSVTEDSVAGRFTAFINTNKSLKGLNSFEKYEDEVNKPLEDTFTQIEGIIKTVRNKIDEKLQNVPDTYKATEGGKAKKIDPSEAGSLRTYMEWYNAPNALPEDLRIDEKTASMMDVLRTGYLYKSHDDPLRGFTKFLQDSQGEFLDFLRRSAGDEKNIPSQSLNAIISDITKLTNFVNSVPFEDIDTSESEKKAAFSLLSNLVSSTERLRDRQASHIQSLGKVPKGAEPSRDTKEASSSGKTSPSSSSGIAGQIKSSLGFSNSRDKPSDERRNLDAMMANDAPQILSREVSGDALKMYSDQLTRFLNRLKEANPLLRIESSVLKDTDDNLKKANDDIQRMREQPQPSSDDAKSTAGPGETQFRIEQVGKRKKELMMGMLNVIKSQIDDYEKIHEDFALKQHRDGLRYMLYWRDIQVDENARKMISEYFDQIKKIIQLIDEQTQKARVEYTSALQGSPEKFENLAKWSSGVPADDYDAVLSKINSVNDHMEDMRSDVMQLYEGDGQPVSNAVLAAPFLIMYFIKLLRILFVWASLHFAEHVFQLWYARTVYGKNEDPPSPVTMIGIFLLIDMTMNLSLMAILFVVMKMFDTSSGRFPINASFLKAYAVDYLCVTAALFVITAVIAQVVQTKKYFRYRYEGDRGIRALQTISFYVAVVLLLIPFFRMVHF